MNLMRPSKPSSSLMLRLRSGVPIVTDGGTGAELLRRTGSADYVEAAERLTAHEIHRDFFEAGAELIVANTFAIAADLVKRPMVVDPPIQPLVTAAARAGDVWVALSVGPGGSPQSYREMANAVAVGGAVSRGLRIDAVFIETMTALADADAALREMARLEVPMLVSFAVDADGVGYGGLSVREIAAWASDARPAAVGFNCGVGPAPVLDAGRRLADLVDLPLALRPAASAPGHAVSTPRIFAQFAREAVSMGARVIGGCCGAGPDHIRALVDAIALG